VALEHTGLAKLKWHFQDHTLTIGLGPQTAANLLHGVARVGGEPQRRPISEGRCGRGHSITPCEQMLTWKILAQGPVIALAVRVGLIDVSSTACRARGILLALAPQGTSISMKPSLTRTLAPPTHVPTTMPPFFSARASRTLGRPISTPWAMRQRKLPLAASCWCASSPASAQFALPVAGSSATPARGANIRARMSNPSALCVYRWTLGTTP